MRERLVKNSVVLCIDGGALGKKECRQLDGDVSQLSGLERSRTAMRLQKSGGRIADACCGLRGDK